MYDSPVSLQQYCLDYICGNITAVCTTQPSPDEPSASGDYTFKDANIFIPKDLSEQLLKGLSDQGVLTDEILNAFDSNVTRLETVSLSNAASITTKGLRKLRSHKIRELKVTGLTGATVNDLIGCLGEWSLKNLRSLNVGNSTFFSNGGKFCVVVALSKLRNLQVLNVSNTEFNRHGLEIVTEDLPSLESLDISETRVKDLSSLRKCKDRLKSLSMYNLKNLNNEKVIPVLSELVELRHLDISEDKEQPLDVVSTEFRMFDFLKRNSILPHLESLDISGKDDLDIEDLKNFMDSHPNLCFLGLVHTDICFDEMFTKDIINSNGRKLTVTGFGTELQLMESLKRYPSRRSYVQKSLFYMYEHTQIYMEPRVDIIQLIIPAVKSHPKVLSIQMAATACLYNLSKGSLGQKIHPRYLHDIVDVTLFAMVTFPEHMQLQKNTLLTLCSDRILQDVTFNRFRCAELVMDCLIAFDDPSMNRMSVAICSILAAKISTEETSILGAKPAYMLRLLDIVTKKVQEDEVDIMMKFTLSALWNLTDESPKTCAVFLEMGGMDLFLRVLEKFKGENAIETKVLGLVNNIAEVKHLRRDLMKEDFLLVLRTLLHSEQIDVSYFAAGIVAHLTSDGPDLWEGSRVCRKSFLTMLEEIVMSWENPETEMVAYRSFSPFFPLLSCFDSHEVQLWAVWAIHHVCSKNPNRYCSTLVMEGGMQYLEALLNYHAVNCSVIKICKDIMEVIKCQGNPPRLTCESD